MSLCSSTIIIATPWISIPKTWLTDVDSGARASNVSDMVGTIEAVLPSCCTLTTVVASNRGHDTMREDTISSRTAHSMDQCARAVMTCEGLPCRQTGTAREQSALQVHVFWKTVSCDLQIVQELTAVDNRKALYGMVLRNFLQFCKQYVEVPWLALGQREAQRYY